LKYRRTLVSFTITFLSVILATGTLTAANFADQSSVSTQKQSNEVFVDPFLQEASPTKQTRVSERLIVMFNPTVGKGLRKNLLSTIEGVEIIQAYKIIPGVCITAPLGATESIKKLNGVEAIWLDHKVEALKNSNQIVFGHEASPMLSDSARLINAPSLWTLGINGSGIVIAVVDTGINWNHTSLDDLDDNPATVDPKVIANVSFVPGVPTGFDDNGHGTHVAGIAAGTGGPSHTYMGVAPGAQLYAVKVLDSTGSGQWSWVVAGIEWSVENNADIITMSLGGSGYPYDPVSMASDAAVDAGIVVTVAAGNDPYYGAVLSPGLAMKVVTVGATTKGDTIAPFSSKGPNLYDYRGDPDIVAPGVGIMSADAWNTTGYIPMSGTSMATPHVAGGAALLLQAFVNATPNLVASALMASAVDIGYDSYTQGAGRIDVLGAYNLVTESRRQGTLSLSLKKSLQPNSPRTLQEEVSPQYTWFRNSRIGFYVDDFGNIFSLYFDGRDQWAVMAWRIAYNTSNLASWFDLEVIQPVSMRVSNKTYQQALGALRTPDKSVAIFVMVELFGNETWARTSFMVWPMGVTLENLRIFYIEDVGMNQGWENDWSYYYSSQDIIVVNDTLKVPPAQHFSFRGELPSSAHHVGPWPDAWYAAYYDQLNNETEYIGDDNNAFRWSLGTVSAPISIPVIFGLEYNVSATFSVINRGRTTPPTPFDVAICPELSVSVSGPVMVEPDIPATYTATVSNSWIGDSTDATLTFYLDDTIVNSTVISIPSGASVEAPVNVTMSMGMHFIKAEIYDPSDPLPQNNLARKRVFAGIMFSAVLPCELEVYTYTGFGPFTDYSTAWVNLTIITPALMPDVEIRLTGNLSQVISFVDSPNVGDVEGWAYFAFEVYASGVPDSTYTGFIEIFSAGLVVNKLPITVNVEWNPVPKINKVFFNDTSVLRVTETLGVTINATDLDILGAPTSPSNLTVNIYLLYHDIEWYIMEGPISTVYNNITGLYEFNYTFPADFSLGIFGIGVEAIDPQGDIVRAMVRTFCVENNVPVISAAISPRNVVGNETVSINVTASDIETLIGQLQITATMVTPTEEKIPVQLTLENGMFTTTFNDTSEEGVYVFSAMVTDRDGASSLSVGFFEVDSTLPSVEILSPLDGAVISGIVNLTCITWDAKLENASIVVHGDLVKNWTVSGLQTYAWDTMKLDDGSYTVKLVAQDKAGNTFEKVVAVVVDNTLPEVSITNPEGGDELTSTVIILFNASDDHLSLVLLYIDNTTYSVTGEASYEWNTTTVGDGTHTIKLIAYDKAGNKAETPPITVTVTNLQEIIEESYEEGYREGYDEGRDRGREEGYEEGYVSGVNLGMVIGVLIGSVITAITAITAIIAYVILKRHSRRNL